MNITISRRQSALYDKHGFDLRRWEGLIEEANTIRKEVKSVAQEYDVDWDETKEEESEAVTKALKAEREKKKDKKDDDEDDEED